jgi:hypothetical protein
MSQPPPYVRFQDYSDYQITHQLPGAALAGADMDAEFDRIKTTLDALLANIALIQRDDGAIKNLVVTPDSISSALAIMIANWTIRGAWLTATAYALKDYVTSGASGYVCVVAHTSGVFATDLAAGKWVLVQTKGDQGIQGIQGIQGVAGATGQSGSGFVNRLINGDLYVDQRKEGSALTLTAGANVAYTLDRWYASCTGANITVQQAVGTGVNAKAVQFTGLAGNSGLVFGQRIEARNIEDLINGNVTVQVWLSSTSITSVTWKLFTANSIDAWGTKSTSGTGTETQVATGTLTITSTPTLYTFTANLGSNANRGVDLEFSCGPLVAAQTIKFEACQLESGIVANTFERLSFDTRIARCRRYFAKSYSPGITPATATNIGLVGGMFFVNGTLSGAANVLYQQAMRAAPTLAVWDAAGASNNVSFISANTVTNGQPIASCTPRDIGLNGFSLTVVSGIPSNGIYFIHYTADAEL